MSSPKMSTHAKTLTNGTLIAAAVAVCVAQVALAIPAVLNGLFQQDLHTSSVQLTWISDAFLVPVTLLELTFGVLGDLFGRKRLLLIGRSLLAVGELVAQLTGVHFFDLGAAVTLHLSPAQAYVFDADGALLVAPEHKTRGR